MAFFQSAVGTLQTLVIALGAGLGIWGEIIVLRHGSCKYLPIILRELLHLIEGLEERNTIVGEHLRMTRPNGGFGC